MDYSATLMVVPGTDDTGDDDVVDHLIDALAAYHPTASRDAGHWQVTITLPAHSLSQAITTAQALAGPLGELIGMEVLPTAVFDKRAGLEALEVELLSVSQAAARLGVTPQTVRDRINNGTLPALRIGRNWAVPEAALSS